MFYIKTKYFVFGALSVSCLVLCIYEMGFPPAQVKKKPLQLIYEAVCPSRRATHHKF